MRENMDQKISEYGHFFRSATKKGIVIDLKNKQRIPVKIKVGKTTTN